MALDPALSPLELEQLLRRLSRRFSIARITPDRTEELHRFFQEAYRDQPNAVFWDPEQTRAHWRWVTELHPQAGPRGPAGWICLKEGRIVGYFGMTPAMASARGRETAVCWGRDLIVAPETRSGGAGPVLIQAALKESGRPFLVAGLNPVSHALFHKMGFFDFGRVPLYIKIRDPLRFAQSLPIPGGLKPAAAVLAQAYRFSSRFSVPPRGPKLSFEILQRFDERFDRWWREVEPAFPCVIRRTSAEMNWRYFRHPRHRYTVLAAAEGSRWKGVAVARHGRSKGFPACFITELLADPRDGGTLLSLLMETEEELQRSAAEPPVLTRCTVGSAMLQRTLLRGGFFRVPSTIHWMVSSAAGPEGYASLSRREEWLINGGDSDLDVF